MFTKKIGPKGQILIPNPIREAMGLGPGAEVVIEMRGDEIVITRPKIEGSYTDYYLSTRSPKLKRAIDVKEVVLGEVMERHGVY